MTTTSKQHAGTTQADEQAAKRKYIRSCMEEGLTQAQAERAYAFKARLRNSK